MATVKTSPVVTPSDATALASIRALVEADLSQVVALHTQCMESAWSHSQWQSVIGGRYASFVVEQGDAIVAVAVFHVLFDELELQTLAVDPVFRRRGLAQALVSYALGVYNQASTVLLEVDAANTAAVALYQRLGFETTAVRKNYYQHSSANGDALLMTKSVNKEET